MQLPEAIHVVPGQPELAPRGQSITLGKKVLFLLWSFLLPLRFLNLARKAGAIGFIWLLEPLALTGLFLALLWRKPLYSVVIGSPQKSFAIRKASATSITTKVFYHCAASAAAVIDALIARHSHLLLVTGPKLVNEFGTGVPFSTSVFSKNDIVVREDTCQGDRIRWMYSGRLSVEKGVDTFLRALAAVREDDPRHEAVLIGPVDPKFPLQELLHELHLHSAVTCVGRQPWPEVLHSLRQGDLYVFLSLHEGMPKAPLEAMAQGLPVIVTPTGADQFVKDGINGLVVPVNSVEDTVHAVQRLLQDTALRRRLITEGLRTAETRTYESSLTEVSRVVHQHFPQLVSTRNVAA